MNNIVSTTGKKIESTEKIVIDKLETWKPRLSQVLLKGTKKKRAGIIIPDSAIRTIKDNGQEYENIWDTVEVISFGSSVDNLKIGDRVYLNPLLGTDPRTAPRELLISNEEDVKTKKVTYFMVADYDILAVY